MDVANSKILLGEETTLSQECVFQIKNFTFEIEFNITLCLSRKSSWYSFLD
jgi:hypothetical protein